MNWAPRVNQAMRWRRWTQEALRSETHNRTGRCAEKEVVVLLRVCRALRNYFIPPVIASLNLKIFHSLPLSCVTLTVLQNRFPPPLKTRTGCLHFVLAAVSSWSGEELSVTLWCDSRLRVSLLEKVPHPSAPHWWCWLWPPHSIKGLSDFSTA